MTNREAYNQFIRGKVDEQLAFMEKMSNQELVDYTVKYPGYHIEVNLGDMLCLFKCNSGKMPVGSSETVASWLDSERTEEIMPLMDEAMSLLASVYPACYDAIMHKLQ